MFGNSKEYQDIQKLYAEKVSKPEQLDEKPKNPLDLSGALNRVKQTGAKNPLELSMPSIKKNTTPPPETKTTTPPPSPRLKADITTNQRQSRALAADDKNVKLNKFSRTQRYAADAKGVKLVPGAKVGQTVNRSTVQTKAAFDFGGIKKGERLGVMTRNQRRKYDLMAAQRAKKTEPKPDIKPIDANPFQGGPKTDDKKPIETKTTERKRPQYQINRDRQNRLRQQQNKGRAERQFGFLKPKPIEKKEGQTSVRRRGGGVKTKPESSDVLKAKPIEKKEGQTSVRSRGGGVKTKPESKVKPIENKEEPLTKQQQMRQKLRNNRNRQESYDAYDVVLEYLLTSQQAATIEEANYIMTEMDAETIQDIVSQQLNEQN